MNLDRRQFLAGGAVASLATHLGCGEGTEASPTLGDLSTAREDFPCSDGRVYMNHASQHPVSLRSAQAMQKYCDYLAHVVSRAGWVGNSEETKTFVGARRREAKDLFAKLINAKPSEIAYCQSTQVGENIVANGMDIQEAGGNVVTNDLHYSSCLYSYKMRQKAGLDVRIIRHRDWELDLADFEKAIDAKTELVALTLVSNVNGYLADVKAISDLAHSRGAYVYADIIQGAGAVPIDVEAMGLDFAACSTYKWLMGLRGLAYLYVKEDLQGSVVRPTSFGGGIGFNYAPWTETPDATKDDITYTPKTGAAQYEVGNVSSIGCVCQYEALNYIHRIGVDKIQAHATALTERLRKELHAIGYPSITPPGNRSPIVTFRLKDPDDVRARLKRANVEVTLRFGNQMRVAVSVLNNDEDVDRLVGALT